jgi:hypothetical protein
MTFKLTTTARKLKVSLVIDAAPFAALRIPDDVPRVEVTVTVGGRTVSADLATKSVKKAVKALADHGVDGVVLVLQGALSADNRIDDAGIVAQIKEAKPQAA